MTGDQFAELLRIAGARPGAEGWQELSERTLTLHTAFNGAPLSFARVEKVRQGGQLVQAGSTRGEVHVFRLEDLYSATVDANKEKARKAGFM